jgi:hypothetical protein
MGRREKSYERGGEKVREGERGGVRAVGRKGGEEEEQEVVVAVMGGVVVEEGERNDWM